jgi:hypothetical protein
MQGRDDKYIQNFVNGRNQLEERTIRTTRELKVTVFLGVKQNHVSETDANVEKSLRAVQVRGIS